MQHSSRRTRSRRSSSRQTRSRAAIRSRSRAASSKRRASASSRSRPCRRGSAVAGRSSSSGVSARAASCAVRRDRSGPSNSLLLAWTVSPGPGWRCDDRVAALSQPHVAAPAATRARCRADGARGSGAAPRAPPRARSPSTRHSIRSAAAERRLDGRPLPVAAEVRAQARAQVARPADVEDLVVAAEEEVDAGPGRRAEREVALVEQAPRPASRRAPLRSATVRAPRSCASPISASSSSAVARASGSARWHGRSAVPRNHASWPRPKPATRPASSLRASRTVSTTGEPMREPVSRSVSRSRNARSKRALCATSTASPANARKLRTASAGRGAPRSCSFRSPVTALAPAAIGMPWIDERLELGLDLEAAQAHGPDLADPGLARAQARRLEVDDDVRRVLEQERRARAARRARPRRRSTRAAHRSRRRPRAASARGRPAPAAGRRAAAPRPPRAPARAAPRRAPRGGRPRLA